MKRTLQTIFLSIGLLAFSFSAEQAYGDVGDASLPGSIKNSISKTDQAKVDTKTAVADAKQQDANMVMPAATDVVSDIMPVANDVLPLENDVPAPAPDPLPVPQSDDALNSVIYFPNPVKDILTVRFPKKGHYTVTISNIIGDKVLDKTVSDESELKLDLSEMQNGMFFLSYEYDGKIVTKRFSKSN